MNKILIPLAALFMSCVAVLPAAAGGEYMLTSEQAELRQKYEEITFPELIEECGNIWIGEVLSIQDQENTVIRPEPQLEVIVGEDGEETLEWVDRHTEQWRQEALGIKLHVLAALSGYTYAGLPMRFESTALVEQYVSLTDAQILETEFRNIPDLKVGDKLLVFGAPYYWSTKAQFLVSGGGNVACTYKTGAGDSNGGVALDDMP